MMEEKKMTWQIKYGQKDIKRVYTEQIVDFSGVAEASEEGEVKVAFTNPFYVPDYVIDKDRDGDDRKQSVADRDMEELIRGIEEFGVLVPLIVREKGDKYELLSGYRRKKAVEIINANRTKKMKVPVIVVPDCDDERAALILTTSNAHRSKISLKEQIKACGITYRTMCKTESGKSNAEIKKTVADLFNVLESNVPRYSMLMNLNDGLLDLMAGEDESENRTRKRSKSKDGKVGKIRLSRRAGVFLATLDKFQQEVLLKVLEDNKDIAVSVKMASEIRKKFKGKPDLTEAELLAFIHGDKEVKPEEQPVENKFQAEKINWNDLLSDVDNEESQKIFCVLKDFLKKWHEAGSPENFEIKSLERTQQAVESSPEA